MLRSMKKRRRSVMMKNRIGQLLLVLIPFYVSYAIISDIGKPHHNHPSIGVIVHHD